MAVLVYSKLSAIFMYKKPLLLRLGLQNIKNQGVTTFSGSPRQADRLQKEYLLNSHFSEENF